MTSDKISVNSIFDKPTQMPIFSSSGILIERDQWHEMG